MAKDNAALVNVLGDLKAGRAVPPEAVASALKGSGVDEDAVNRRALIGTPVVEWEDSNTTHHRVPVEVPEHLARGEEAADDALAKAKVTADTNPEGTGSNDPAVNALATGEKPFAKSTGIGNSGQVIDAGEYREDEKDAKAKTTATAGAKASTK